MTEPPLVNHFDRSKPFYPLVFNYLVFIHGLIELSSRLMIELTPVQTALAGSVPVQRAEGVAATAESVAAFYSHPENRQMTRFESRIRLQNRSEKKFVEVQTDLLVADLRDHHNEILFWAMRSASLMILAWETTEAFHTHDPLWEFLRHCRHAAAHGGRFRFLHGEPKRPAAWRDLEVVPALEGTPLFLGGGAHGLLSPGDPILLLWDIEQAFPEMAVGANS